MRNKSAHQVHMYTHLLVLLCRWIWIYEYLYIYEKVGQKIPCFCHHIHFKMYSPHNLHVEKIRPHIIIWMITLCLRRRFDFGLKGTNSIHQSLFSTRGKWMVCSHRQLGDFIFVLSKYVTCQAIPGPILTKNSPSSWYRKFLLYSSIH